MKKIYLVKKDPALEGQDNWIMMDGYEFAMFIKTSEGQARKENFSVIPASDQELDTVIIECSKEKASEMKKENQRHEYLEKSRKESGMAFLSTNSPIDEDRNTLEDLIADHRIDLEADLVEQCEIAALYAAIEQLTEKEHELLQAFYLANHPMTEKEYAETHEITQPNVSYWKKQVLKKLRKCMSEWKN